MAKPPPTSAGDWVLRTKYEVIQCDWEKLSKLLADGWEPFSSYANGRGAGLTIVLRRPVSHTWVYVPYP